ncbi:hypothetical protein VKT23_013064 [Stygiomarasmius scandens]|uniref:DUF6589 domain-containing protein n=1 Tax=Marasmiellus scandens TaxID=2682957 RepID=A0ABR1J8C3_9AGAR
MSQKPAKTRKTKDWRVPPTIPIVPGVNAPSSSGLMLPPVQLLIPAQESIPTSADPIPIPISTSLGKWKYDRLRTPSVPERPAFMHTLSSPLDSPFPSTPLDTEPPANRPKRIYNHIQIPVIPDIPPWMSESIIPASTDNTVHWPSFKPIRHPEDTDSAKADDILDLIRTKFVGLTCEGPKRLVSLRNRSMVQNWLQGRSLIHAVDNVDKIYNHRYSYPAAKAELKSERNHHFSPSVELSSIHYAWIAISSWALRIVGNRLHKGVGDLTIDLDDKDDPNFRTRVPIRSLQPEHIKSFSMKRHVERLKKRDPAVWFITECMAASRCKGSVVVKRIRPHPMIQVATISSFIVSRNKYATGYLPLILGIWHFACRSHVDVKRVHTLLGLSVGDSTARTALEHLSRTSLSTLQEEYQTMAMLGILSRSTTLDNTQEYVRVHEFGLGKSNTLRVGCAAFTAKLYGVKPGAFARSDYIQRVVANARSNMTTESLFQDIDSPRMHLVLALHFLRALVDYVPCLDGYHSDLSQEFRSKPVAIRRMEKGRKTEVQPLGTNSEREMETQGMKQAILDFDKQKGLKPELFKDLLDWYTGDGGSFAAMHRVRKYGMIMQSGREEDVQEDYESMTGKIFTCEIWHMRSTCLNSLAANHYGPEACPDPSSISHIAAASGMYRPQNFKACSFYPTSRAMTLAWNTQVLDCWRLILKIDNNDSLVDYFQRLDDLDKLPSFKTLLDRAKTLVHRYASLSAYNRVLSKTSFEKLPEDSRAPIGTVWEPPSSSTSQRSSAERVPTGHVENDQFDGDRVLANSILFMLEYGWWIEAAYAG